jgi:DNA polymerase-3 subunit delta
VADLLADIRAGKLAPVYFLVSQQPLLLERAVTAIRDASVPPDMRAWNADVVEGRGASGSRVLAALQTLPMMGERRLVHVRDVAAMQAAEMAHLLAYLDDPNPRTVFLATAAKVDKRIKLFASAKKKGFLHEMEPPRRLAQWIRDEAAARGADLDSRAASRLEDVVGKDLSRLALALEQLRLYAGDRRITSDDVDDLIADTRERSVFELTDAIGEGALPRALAAVSSLCEQRQSAIGVVVMLARHMRQLGACQAALSDGASPSELPRILGVPPFIADKLGGQARRYTVQSVQRGLELLADTDASLKGYTQHSKTLGRELGERIMLERAVTTLVELGSAPAGSAPASRTRGRR